MSDDDDERPEFTPLDAVELGHAMEGIAVGTRSLYDSLIEQGFDEGDAMKLTCAYIHGVAGGKLS